MIFMFQKWELALIAGLLTGLLLSPAEAQSLPLSRWQLPESPAPVQYQVSLFPFAVGAQEAPALSWQPAQTRPELEIRFRLSEWWEQIQSVFAP